MYGDGTGRADGFSDSPARAWPPPAGTVLVTIGDIACTESTVVTPAGTFPLRGTTWIVSNQTQTTERIPPHAIVLAIIFFLFCLLGLFFLLMKERTTKGFVQVSVQGDGFYHATQIPVSHLTQVPQIEAQVNYARTLAAHANTLG